VSTQGAAVGATGVHEGDVLAGKYRVDRVIGTGGMGVVVAAHHLLLDEKVAIKLLLPEALAAPEAVARFDREARAAVKIKSEHVARIIDVGKLDDGAPYMVMEYLEGSDLSAWLTRHGRLPIDQAVDFVLQACEAIAEAHAMGMVHRDLKPANLYCIRRPDGALSIKVLDFGISKLTGPVIAKGMSMTRTQTVLGSPFYMSPEQLESSKGVDARADIWALGIILYELLTGSVPFSSDVFTELVIRIVNSPAPPARAMRHETPPALEGIILRCLEKDRDRRFANVAELARALVEFASPRAMLSLERIEGVMQGAHIAVRPSMASVPPPTPPAPQGPMAITPPNTVAMGAAYGVTPSSWGHSGPGRVLSAPPPPRGNAAIAWVAAIASILVVVGVIVVVLVVRASKPVTATAAARASAVALPSAVPDPPPAASVEPSAQPTASVASAEPPVPAPSTTQARPASTPSPRPAWAPPAQGGAPKASPGPARKDCDPPYFVDSAGHRQYKKECF
jgi:serine/threonine-protein kinase